MAKAAGKQVEKGSRNRVLEQFLIALAVDEKLRQRYSQASEREKTLILGCEFKIGNGTIDALLSGKDGRVRARLRLSDQQGTPSPKPPANAARAKRRARNQR